MPPASTHDRTNPLPSWVVTAVCLLGLTALGFAALDLSAHGLAYYLNSDFLTPYFFCSDLLNGHYPISGWTLSASPYFVPDHLVLSGLLAVFGRTGPAYALFTLVYYPLLFVLAGGCVKTAVGRAGPAFLATLLVGNLFLALRVLPGHARCLWWIGAPTCHGGVLLLGFGYLWIVGAGLQRDRVGKLPVGLFAVALAGLLSDSLFLFQVVLPASVALYLGRRRHPAGVRFLRWQGAGGAAALLGTQLFKPLCRAADWFYFSRIIRVAPTPANQWHALGRFVADVPVLMRANWGFALLLAAAAALLFRAMRSLPRPAADPPPERAAQDAAALDFYRIFGVASLCIMLPLPVLSCGWKDADNVRYLFNWLVLPGFLVALEAAARWPQPSRRSLVGAAALFLVAGGWAAHGLSQQSLHFPYPSDVAALDDALQRRGLQRGLAQYWNAKNVTGLSHAGLELRQIRANAEPFFWDNNVFAYYQRTADGRLTWPAYQYILTDGLDEPAVARTFGEPREKVSVDRFRIWIYGDEGQGRIRAVLEPAVRQKLGPRRLAAAGLPSS